MANDIDAALLDLWRTSCQPKGPSMPCVTSWSPVSATPSNLSVRAKPVSSTAETTPFGRDALMSLLDLADRGIQQLIEMQREHVGHLIR